MFSVIKKWNQIIPERLKTLGKKKWNQKKMVPFFTNVGDVLITRQDCTHGDFPAKVPHKKAMVVINYF